MSDEEVRRVLGLMYQQDTLRMMSALVLTGGADAAGLDREAAARALDRLERGGLVVRDDDGSWRARPERFRELLHAIAPPPEPVSPQERIIRTFLVDGRLRAIPTRRGKRLEVLDYIVRVFEPGVRYSEKEVNVALRAFHDDYATLRRYLIDEDLLTRENGVYWRSGGTVEI
ncbi:DUF2087 domain-containing protein [Thermopolyspora sp. NPDC052614]|uniref:DUF2087 domain-containing protein n=1 Tax=Thermopolyspora sp. NPDC052614 TaxID=3155682 RepID=UPI0034197BA5